MNKFIKNLSTVNIVLLVVLMCTGLLFILTVINSIYKKYKTNNSVEQTINRIKGIREGFETNEFNQANMNSGKQAEETISIAEKAKKEKEKQEEKEKLDKEKDGDEDPESGDSDEEVGLGELGGNTGSSLDVMFENLKSLEKKCKDYEESQDKNDMDDKRKHEELIQEQLDIENVKINELTQIVNFYRKKYTEKKSVTGQCRKQKFGELEKTMKDVVDLSNQHNNSASKHEVNVKLPSN